MNKTSIDWPSLAYSWNPIVGCANGCTYCYARKISNRFKMIPDFLKPVIFPNRIDEPMKAKNPSTIFVGSMCDIFSEGVKSMWVHHIIETVKNCPQHTFMFLTKKPEYYLEWLWPSNCILGTTMEKPDVKGMLRYQFMTDYGQCKKFISIEPILGSFAGINFGKMDLIIVGADSTPGASVPPLEWVKSIDHPDIWYKKNLRKHYPELKNLIEGRGR